MRLIDPKNPANRLYVSDFVIEQMQKIPTIEAEPVKHGRWEYIADFGDGNCYGHCSNCNTQHKAKNPTDLKLEYMYCRWCGAKMDGGNDHLANGVTAQKWIPVTERLPEDGELVLAWSESLRDLGMGVLDEFEPTQVTHWMPLPEPPEDGGAENGD